jgi:hypothetical protein
MGCGAQPWADAALSGTRNGLMQLERATPEVFITKGVEAKSVSAFLDHLPRVFSNLRIGACGSLSLISLILSVAPVSKKQDKSHSHYDHEHTCEMFHGCISETERVGSKESRV